jgi:hypothetical protein
MKGSELSPPAYANTGVSIAERYVNDVTRNLLVPRWHRIGVLQNGSILY